MKALEEKRQRKRLRKAGFIIEKESEGDSWYTERFIKDGIQMSQAMAIAYLDRMEGEIKTFHIRTKGEEGMGGCGMMPWLHGSIKAHSFKEACDILAENDEHFGKYYDPKDMTFWGIKLYLGRP